MSFDYESRQNMVFERLTTANDPKISKIMAKFLVDENNFYKKYIKNKKVLFAGSGMGDDSIRIANYNKEVVGIDILPKLVDYSLKRK